MTGSQILELLNADTANNTLTLGVPNNLGSTAVDHLLEDYFSSRLVATVGAIDVGENSVTYPRAGLQTSGFILYGATAAVSADLRFSDPDDNGVIQLVVIVELPSAYHLTDSFPVLATMPSLSLNQLTMTAVKLLLDSTLPPQNVHLAATLPTDSGLLKSVGWMLGGSLSVTGTIVLTVDHAQTLYPLMNLAAPVGTPFSLAGYSLALSVKVYTNLLPLSSDSTAPGVLAMVLLETDLVTPALTVPVTIPLVAPTQTVYTILLNPAVPTPTVGSLQDLSGFTGGTDPATAIPPSVPVGPHLVFKGFSAVLDTANRQLNNFTLSIGLDTNWTVIDGLVLEGLFANFLVPNPLAPTTFQAQLGANLMVGTAGVTTTVFLPDERFEAQLNYGSTLDVIALLNTFAGSVVLPGTNTLVIDAFDAVADIPGNQYRLQTQASGEVAILPTFLLNEIEFAIQYGQGTLQMLQFGSLFRIADAELYLNVTYAANDWILSGGTWGEQQISLTALVVDIAAIFGVVLPDSLPDIQLATLEMANYTVSTGDFQFRAKLLYFSDSDPFLKEIEGDCDITVTHPNGGTAVWTGIVHGSLLIGDARFDITYDFRTDQVLTGQWTAVNGATLGINDLAAAFGATTPPIPSNLDLALNQATFSYDLTNSTVAFSASSARYGKADFVAWKLDDQYQFFFGLAIDSPISLSNLPLIGQALSEIATVQVENLIVLVTSVPIAPDKVSTVNRLVPAGYPLVPSLGLPSVVALGCDLNLGGTITHISLGMDGNNAPPGNGAALVGGTAGGAAAPPNPAQTTPNATPARINDGVTWFDVQKAFGPVTFQKIGFKYENQIVWFLLSADLNVGGLDLSLVGASIGTPLTSFSPRFRLEGLGLDYSSGPVHIGGAFLNVPQPDPDFEYAGAAVIKAAPFSLSAVGAYGTANGVPSLFVYASVSGAFGGPPCFFVTGLMAGFGYNRGLLIPGPDQIWNFPLVAGLTNPSAVGGTSPTPMEVLAKLETGGWITKEVGQNWLVAGIQFTSYDLVNSTALLVVEFGKEFAVALLGLARAQFPPAPSPVVYAYVELQLEALFKPSEGILLIAAALSPNSFLLDRACKLTGGFAFEMWFAGEHTGDFVITVGGYSPAFDVPAWYPREPQVGFSWSLDSTISVTGGAYFAMTPSAIMAGAGLSVTYQDGDLRAWFTAYADLIIWYKPFHFLAHIATTVGASYRLNLLFNTTTVKAELGAELVFWGPPTGGTVTVHWWVLSFTVSFGADATAQPGPVPYWVGASPQNPDGFATLLPAPADSVKIVPVTGLNASPPPPAPVAAQFKAVAAEESATVEVWTVGADRFSFTTSAAVPATQLFLGSTTSEPYATGGPLSVQPMQLRDLTSWQRVSLYRYEDATPVEQALTQWSVVTRTANVPTAMWGAGTGDSVVPADQQLIADQLIGFQITAPLPVLTPGPGPMSETELAADPLSPGTLPLQTGQPASGPVPEQGQNTILIIEEQIATTAVPGRTALATSLGTLGFGLTNGDLTLLAQGAGTLYPDEPLLVA